MENETLETQRYLPPVDGASTDISINNNKCRRCFYCIQICPAKAIRVEKNSIKIIPERCILCGSCVTACPRQALEYKSGLGHVVNLLSGNEKTIACLDPAFPADLNMCTPGQLATTLKKIGFTEVWEGAFGAELISRAYKKLLSEENSKPVISSFCPVIVFYIQKYLPRLIPNLAPIVSPMIATGRAVKSIKGPDWKVIYITPCMAQVREMNAPEVAGVIDEVVTFRDIRRLISSKGINCKNQEETSADGPKPYLGRMISVTPGLYKTIDMHYDILMDDISVIYGPKRVIVALNQLAADYMEAKFLDFVYCFGCVNGPFVDSELSVLGRRQVVVQYAKAKISRQNMEDVRAELDMYENIDLTRRFDNMEQKLPVPTEEQIMAILKKIGKTPPNHNLDCRACGHESCRDKAIAVAQGIAETEYCLHYLLEQSKKIYQQLKKSHKQLQQSHQELEQTHAQLIKTEKFASLGQLAAGVAHEINNPLGTITIYSHLLLKSIEDGDPRKEDLELIISEANRAKEIVQGLLSFARETKLRESEMNVNDLLEDVLALISNQSLFYNIKIEKSFYDDVPTITADEMKLKQVFLNIILNAAQAMEGNGKLSISTATDKRQVKIKIQDTGPGIPPENMDKLFSPFFTTKEKGTGLGLAISYGIIERHKGKIDVFSELGKGSAFTIILPIAKCEDTI